MASKPIYLVNQKFGKLTVLNKHNTGRSNWVCKCDCGNQLISGAKALRNGKSASCGCDKVHGNRTHGLSNTREYGIWSMVKYRCQSPNYHEYHLYGGRGISVCDRWLEFSNFLADMGRCPSGYSLDRIDSNGNYEPSNCRWADSYTQGNNRCNNKKLTYNGVTKTQSEWARELGISKQVLRGRINAGWSLDRIFGESSDKSKYVTYNGVTKPLYAWVDELKKGYHTVKGRLRMGWTFEEAFELVPHYTKTKHS